MDDLPSDPALARMQALLQQWQQTSDPRMTFLRCYSLMTRNMLLALDRGEFQDAAWVNCLLDHFADYYFVAIDAYEQDTAAAPLIWQFAHNTSRIPDVSALQKLLLGVNAHINYDLPLAVVDVLDAEWGGLSDAQRAGRYADFCHVNAVIERTIDAVQDDVIEPSMPLMDVIDRLMGSVDELLISRLLTHWRETVWHNAVHLLALSEPEPRERLIRHIEADALRLAELIRL